MPSILSDVSNSTSWPPISSQLALAVETVTVFVHMIANFPRKGYTKPSQSSKLNKIPKTQN